MTKSSKKKSSANENKNILYLHENDAKALGIVEGGVQRVFVDGREVDVTFVDEHEIIQMSPEEKKIYDEAERIAQKYIQESQAEHENRRNASRFGSKDDRDVSHLNKKESRDRNKDRYYADCDCERQPKQHVSFIQRLFGKREANGCEVDERKVRRDAEIAERNQLKIQRQREMERREQERRDRLQSSRELRTIRREEREEERRKNEVKRQEAANRRHRFQVRSDIFTEEELEILQGIISRSKSPHNVAASRKASSKSTRR